MGRDGTGREGTGWAGGGLVTRDPPPFSPQVGGDMSITEQRFNGWRRLPRGRWKCVVFSAASDREALERLRELTAGEMFVDLCVLAPGRHPSDQLDGPPVRKGG